MQPFTLKQNVVLHTQYIYIYHMYIASMIYIYIYIVSSQGPSLRYPAQVSNLNHGPQLHHRLGPQLHHVESGIHYKFRTRGCPKTAFALKKAMFTALQVSFSRNNDIFWRNRKIEKSILFWPHHCENTGYESEKVRKMRSKPLKSESYHHRALAYVIQPGIPSQSRPPAPPPFGPPAPPRTQLHHGPPSPPWWRWGLWRRQPLVGNLFKFK